MYATIQRWGNSNGIRLPKALLDAVGLRANDRVELIQTEDAVTIKKAPASTHRTLEERLTSFYGKPLEEIQQLHEDELDWGPAQGGETW